MANRYLLWIEDLKKRDVEKSERLGVFEDLFRKKLWHQLTTEIEISIQLKSFTQDANFLPDLYNNFIAGFAYRLNPLKLAKIAVVISKQFQQPKEAVLFLEDVLLRMEETKQPRLEQPLLYLRLQIAQVKLYSNDVPGCKSIMEISKKLLDTLQDVDPEVSAAFHYNRSMYYKQEKDYAEFYKSSLLYLAFISSETLPHDTKLTLAVDISLAALLGDNIYNFGELLLHPLIKVLDESSYAWLHKMLKVFNNGDMDGYSNLLVEQADTLNSMPAMVENERKLMEKITILALTELIFTLPADKRVVPLKDIAKHTKLDIDGVEFLLMKTLSLKLIQGTIDEVAQTAHPRVLTLPQVAALNERLTDWVEKVDQAKKVLYVDNMTFAT